MHNKTIVKYKINSKNVLSLFIMRLKADVNISSASCGTNSRVMLKRLNPCIRPLKDFGAGT